MASDEELMSAYVAGDAAAFEQLFRRYCPLLLGVVGRRTESVEEARDLVQQTFLQVHRARLDFRADARFRPWVFAIALNLVRTAARTRRRRPEVHLDGPQQERLVDPSCAADRVDDADRIRVALAELPADYREAIELRWFDGLSYEEAGAALGASANAVKVRAHRGHKLLRALLEGDGLRAGRTPAPEGDEEP